MSRELDFERPILELERKIESLRGADTGKIPTAKLEKQISKLEHKVETLRTQIFNNLTRWQVVQLARHQKRPFTLDYMERVFTDFVELHGDRCYADDRAIVGGLAKLQGIPVVVLGHQKGRTTQENLIRNFGMPRPEGYRKALRLMALAERFNRPLITMIDTPGAYPGIGAEERGQAQAIAEALERMASLSVPVISVVIGEGGSGGALAIGVANRLLMLEYSTYSVISPEGCASILFKDATFAERAADALRLTADDLLELKIADRIIPEPPGGAQKDHAKAGDALAEGLLEELQALRALTPAQLRDDRYRKYRTLGVLLGEQAIEKSMMKDAPEPPKTTRATGGAKSKKTAGKAPAKRKKAAAKKKTVKKASVKKTATKKKATKKAVSKAARTAKKATAKKTSAKKAASKKKVAAKKKAAAKKRPAKKKTVRKTSAAKKAGSKKATSRKVSKRSPKRGR